MGTSLATLGRPGPAGSAGTSSAADAQVGGSGDTARRGPARTCRPDGGILDPAEAVGLGPIGLEPAPQLVALGRAAPGWRLRDPLGLGRAARWPASSIRSAGPGRPAIAWSRAQRGDALQPSGRARGRARAAAGTEGDDDLDRDFVVGGPALGHGAARGWASRARAWSSCAVRSARSRTSSSRSRRTAASSAPRRHRRSPDAIDRGSVASTGAPGRRAGRGSRPARERCARRARPPASPCRPARSRRFEAGQQVVPRLAGRRDDRLGLVEGLGHAGQQLVGAAADRGLGRAEQGPPAQRDLLGRQLDRRAAEQPVELGQLEPGWVGPWSPAASLARSTTSLNMREPLPQLGQRPAGLGPPARR